MDNIESIELPSLEQPLHMCDAISILDLHWEPCGPLLSHRQITNRSAISGLSARSSGFLVHCAPRNFRASPYFAIRVFFFFQKKKQ